MLRWKGLIVNFSCKRQNHKLWLSTHYQDLGIDLFLWVYGSWKWTIHLKRPPYQKIKHMYSDRNHLTIPFKFPTSQAQTTVKYPWVAEREVKTFNWLRHQRPETTVSPPLHNQSRLYLILTISYKTCGFKEYFFIKSCTLGVFFNFDSFLN